MSLNKKFLNKTAAVPVVEDTFNTLLYTGSGTTSSTQSITGLGFQPDLVWIKQRSGTNPHGLWDSTRGAGKLIVSATTAAESGNAGDLMGSFDADGFQVNRDYLVYTAHDNTNGNGNPTYVAWCWKANGGTTVSNGLGSITTTVQANVAAGFSVVKWTGNETSGQTVGHGLSASPEIAFIKQLDGTREWQVPLFTETSGDYLILNDSDAKATDTSRWSAVSSTTFTIGAQPHTNGSGSPYIAYCFHSVAGYSKIGTYTGTGSSHSITGVGFQPNWIIIKEVDGVDSWEMYDSVRGVTKALYVNGNNAEVTNTNFTSFDSDGFTVDVQTSINESGKTYLYMAFKINVS